MLNVLEVTEVSPGLVNCIVAPVTDATLVALRLLNVAVPADAVALSDGPPSVQLPAPTAPVTTALLDTRLPYWS